jgi:hypothetical protein
VTVPTKTIDIVGLAKVASLIVHKAHDDYVVQGGDLNDLRVLAQRLETGITDANELRDWQNRINLLVSEAVEVK